MEDLANEFSSYAMIEDIASSAPCGLQKLPLSKKCDQTDEQSNKKNGPQLNFHYKSKLNYSVNLSPNVSNSMSQISKSQPKSSRHRYSTRSSSILLKSNSLALSDSESTLSDDTKGQSNGTFFNERKQRIKKSKRKKSEKDVQIYPPYIPTISNNEDQYIYGKRKRSTTISQNSYEQNNGPQISTQCDFNKTNKLIKYNCQNENKMDCDDEGQEDSTSLSEDSNLSDPRFEADDEQSDYYEVSSTLQKKNRQYGRTSLEKTSSFGIVNPFSMLSSTSPSTSSTIWKKKKFEYLK